MTDIIVFVNERPVGVPAGSDARAAATRLDPALGERLARGEAHATDGRGIDLPADRPLEAGAIVRVVVSARRRESDADA
jgi:hypothetical protein